MNPGTRAETKRMMREWAATGTLRVPAAGETGWASHLPLLQAAMVASSGPVLELGAGDGSTPWLHENATERGIVTIEIDAAWLDRFRLDAALNRGDPHPHSYIGVSDWAAAPIESWTDRWGVALVDHAPGERRIHEIRRLANICDLVVVHDTEPGQARHGYGYDAIWGLFRYLRHDTRLNTWTSVLSNTIDVGTWSF